MNNQHHNRPQGRKDKHGKGSLAKFFLFIAIFTAMSLSMVMSITQN
ncbi:hypothetical protein [Vibrio gallicus]|nr:hypothetical protein [Vibrio gallicus]